MTKHTERIEREDLVLFINACLSATSQAEFYEDARGQSLALDFLHEYVCRHYRSLYARTLAAGINDHARARIVEALLCDPSDVPDAQRALEGSLIEATLARLPPQRVYRVLEAVCRRRVTNRRVRALVRGWLAGRDVTFDSVKYRRALRTVVGHFHLATPGETGRFLFERCSKDRAYTTPLYESWRAAHYAEDAVYSLPYTIAVGFARRLKIPRDRFLERIAPMMTRAERFRSQRAAQRAEANVKSVDLSRERPTRLALFAYALDEDERAARRSELLAAMEQSVARAVALSPMSIGRVVAVLDDSYSMLGSREKRLRPLALTASIDALLRASATSYTGLWTSGAKDAPWIDLRPKGSTRLASRVLDALELRPELLVIVSDGYENDPPGALASVLGAYRSRIDVRREVSIVHVNPVFEAANFGAASFGPVVPMVTVREAEDVVTALGFARFADDKATIDVLRAYLDGRVREFLRLDDSDDDVVVDEPAEREAMMSAEEQSA